VRVALIGSADRTDQQRDRAEIAGRARTFAAIPHGRAVARTVARALHALVDEDDLAADRRRRQRVERVQRSDFDNLGFDAFVGRADAATQCRGNQRLRCGPGECDLGVTAHPARHEHILSANFREAQARELVECPAHGGCIAARAGGARPDFRHQRADVIVGRSAGQRPIA
jgi:hypothetical protein